MCSSLQKMTVLCTCGVHPPYTDKFIYNGAVRAKTLWRAGAVMHESQIYPSDIPAAACLLKPVVFPACENSGWLRNPTSVPLTPFYSPLLPHGAVCDVCALSGTLSGLCRGLASLVKIHSRLPIEGRGGRRMTRRGGHWDDVGERWEKALKGKEDAFA